MNRDFVRLEKLLRKEPDNPYILHSYGVFITKTYGFQYGKKYLHKAINLKKDYKDAIINLTEFYLEHNLPFSAIKVLKQANISKYSDLQERLANLKKSYKPEKVSFFLFETSSHIEKKIKNILSQTYPVYEIIVSSKEIKKTNNILKIGTISDVKGDFLALIDKNIFLEETFLEYIMMEFRKNNKLNAIKGKIIKKHSFYAVDQWFELNLNRIIKYNTVYKVHAFKKELKDIAYCENAIGEYQKKVTLSSALRYVVNNFNTENLITEFKNLLKEKKYHLLYPVFLCINKKKIEFNMYPPLSQSVISKMLEVSKKRIFYEKNFEKQFSKRRPKIMLLNLPWRDGTRYGVRAGSRWPFTIETGKENCSIPPVYVPYPFFLAYTTSLLKQEGFYTIFIDAIAEGLFDWEFFERVKGFNPDLILIETATASIYNDIGYIRKLKSILNNSKIILSGTHVSYFKEKFLQEYPCIDGIIIGEFEEAFLNIAKYFKKYYKFDKINQKGFLYFNERGEIEGNSEKTDLVDIDKLPLPERLTLPIYNYEDLFSGMVFPSLQVQSSRGCPFKCIFCIWPQVLYQSSKYRVRNPLKVVDEIEEMVNFYGYKSFYFDDDTFNIGKKRILKICYEIKKRGLNRLPWAVMARADTIDFETLKAMKGAGLISIKFGVESAVQELVTACGKNLDLKKVDKVIKWCKELNLKFHLTFTFGLPGETAETINKTIQYAIDKDPDSVQFSLTMPFPGTKLYKIAENKGLLLTKDWKKYDGARFSVIKGENLTKEQLEYSIIKARKIWFNFKKEQK